MVKVRGDKGQRDYKTIQKDEKIERLQRTKREETISTRQRPSRFERL